MRPRIEPSEAREQETIFEWSFLARGRYPELKLLFAIPNGGSRHPAEAAHLKAQGVKSGVPDMCLPVARGGYHGLYIELKRQKGGRPSANQTAWIEELRKQDYYAAVVHGSDAAVLLITKYLKGELKCDRYTK